MPESRGREGARERARRASELNTQSKAPASNPPWFVPLMSGLMIVLPDMPDLDADDMRAVAALHADHPLDVIRATDAEGRFGHPTLLPAWLLPALLTLGGDIGARDVIAPEKIRPCPLGGTRATMDLDTPESWQDWRAARE